MSETFEEVSATCRSFGVRLLKPRGARKIFILEKDGQRFRLAKSWEQAKRRVGEGMQLLFGQHKHTISDLEEPEKDDSPLNQEGA